MFPLSFPCKFFVEETDFCPMVYPTAWILLITSAVSFSMFLCSLHLLKTGSQIQKLHKIQVPLFDKTTYFIGDIVYFHRDPILCFRDITAIDNHWPHQLIHWG